jgi:hypothetical protein
MRKDKEEAFRLRREGNSYAAIRAKLKIPLATLSDWFRDVDWSNNVRARLTETAKKESAVRIKELGRVRGEHLKRVYEEAREEARQELEVLKYNPLFISGMMLYWGEGDKVSPHLVRLSNSDPELIQFYVGFLQKACRIPENKIKASLLIYPDIEEVANRRFWAFATGLPLGNFTKSVLIQGRHETKRLRYGVCNIVISSAYFKVKMLTWLTALPKELIDRRYYENM